MLKSDIDSIINDYIVTVSQYDYTLGRGTWKLAKREKELVNTVSKLNLEELKYFLDTVLSNESLSVKLSAAVIAIENQYRADEAKAIILDIGKMTINEAKSNAPLWASPGLTDHLFDDRYPYISNIFRQTSALMKESILKETFDIKKQNKIEEIISEQDADLIYKYIDFLNDRKHDGCFMYYGALLAYRYNYHIEEAKNNMIMISENQRNWGRMSEFCSRLLDEHDKIIDIN